MKKQAPIKKILTMILTIVVVIVAGTLIYCAIDCDADSVALEYMQDSENVNVTEANGQIMFDGPGEDILFVFYPGGKVDYKAYAPLLHMLAENGIDCIDLKMPLQLAVFDINRMDKVNMDNYNYSHIYIGGHSLGGAMASRYAAKHMDVCEGLILMGAYVDAELRGEDIKVLSIYGTEDGVLNMDQYEVSRALLPEDFSELVIDGGNHGQFGSYGFQKGDGESKIDAFSQWEQTVSFIKEGVSQ